jgi:hypothetical protein
MDSETIERVRLAATRFRDAIEKCRDLHVDIFFEAFPRGGCGDTADMLGTFLNENGLGLFRYVLGERGSHAQDDYTTHAWLTQDGWIVDIAADQFPEISDRVIVCLASESAWHATFTINKSCSYIALHRTIDCAFPDRLESLYQVILKHLDA